MQTTRRATIASSTAQHLIRLTTTLQQVGIKPPKSITDGNNSANQRLTKIRDYRANAEPSALIREVEAKIADGTAELTDIFSAANARSIVSGGPSSPISNMFENAERIISKDLHATYARHGDAWVNETLRPQVDKLITKILKHTPKLLTADPRRNPRELDVMLYIPEVIEAWGQLHTIYQVFHDLRAYGIIPSTYQRNDCYQFTGNPAARDGMPEQDITWFVWAAQNNHKPGIYTESEHKNH